MEQFPYTAGLRISSERDDLPPFASKNDFRVYGLLDFVLPEECTLRSFSIVRDQTDESNPAGDIPCCVSMSIVQSMEALDLSSPPAAALSPLFHYFHLTRGYPEGAALFDGIRIALDVGVCRSDLHNVPMTVQGVHTPPGAQAEVDAANQKLLGYDPIYRRAGYARLDPTSIDPWIRFLAEGCPIMIGFWMTDAYVGLRSSKVHGPSNGLARHGAHAVTCLGYSLPSGCFLVKDSRGLSFGDNGYWLLPFDRLSEGLVAETWAICKITY